ncbi:MAG: tRNA1(Val) (adenine(37)-N6)-methyltransferase [Bdellovibrionales bacterium]
MSKKDEIHVLGGRVVLRQIEGGFKTSTDSVLLAAACAAKTGDQILDLGCGVGSAGLCVLGRVSGAHLIGIDILPDHIALAHANAKINDKGDYARFVAEDIRDFEDDEFDHVICNPPYMESGSYIDTPYARKAVAIGHGEDDIDLKDWIDAAHRNLRHGGSFTIIHRGDAVDRIIRLLGTRFGAVEIIPLWPKAGVAARRVIVRAIKNRKSPGVLHAGIVLHEDSGDYTTAAEAVLRNGAGLF